MPYSLAKAAKAAGVTHSSIRRAIKAGKISAVRNKHRQWQIKPAELHRVYGTAPVATTSRIDELIVKLRTRQEREQSQRALPTAQQGKPSRLRRVWRWMQAAG
jgi:predicted site-specific integrase-resolvase